jgi:hypothetical protein
MGSPDTVWSGYVSAAARSRSTFPPDRRWGSASIESISSAPTHPHIGQPLVMASQRGLRGRLLMVIRASFCRGFVLSVA